ncbi:hypothetical protein Airi02_018280 [Actinoallomurus iriomotensis]|uniref:Uncharacterized protein n=1 Tax=Actinoallomurus iriomotensis TaxID=478107 RepID=A0A9W6RY11_9ACTN|nr:hypothetical protein Airi02_018280 [Actinoallomurus iriomotensis]
MHPEIVQALMNERVREAHGAAAVWGRRGRVRRPRVLSRYPRLRSAWTAKTA